MSRGWRKTQVNTKREVSMAKCIKIHKTGQVIRVPDSMARDAVERGVAEFAPKRDWKDAGRIVVKDERGISRG